MADPHWTSYVGMATGIIGVITGVSGAILGYVGYRKSNEIKSLDLRLELRKSINDFNSTLLQTEELLPHANKSRERVSAATGNFHSGAMVVWKEQYDCDQSDLKLLCEKAKNLIRDYGPLSPKELEDELVNIHKLQNLVDELKCKYDNALRSDDKERERIKNRHEPK